MVKEATLAAKQTVFIDAVQGIGDILVFDTKRKNQNTEAREILEQLANLLRDLFALRDRDPAKFDHIVVAQRLLKLFKENREEAQLRLAFDPEKSLIAFSTTLRQIMRVHESALEAGNDELSRFATYHLNWILADLVQRPGNAIFIEQILRELNSAMHSAAKKEDRSAYSAAIDWYVAIVFKGMRQKEDGFRLEYLELLDRYLIFAIQFIVSAGHTKLFEAFVSSLIDGVHLSTYHTGKVWEYGHLILKSDINRYRELNQQHGIEAIVNELAASETEIDSKEKLDSWLHRFADLKALLQPHFTGQNLQQAQKIEEDIIECITDHYKYSNLLEVVFRISAYCLAKDRADYIRYLWEYKQPHDSDAHWIGHDAVPHSLREVLNLYFRRSLLDPDFSLLEGHHSISPYLRKYFLLLLARLLQGEAQIALPDFKGWEATRLNGIVHALSELVPFAEDMSGETGMMTTLGFDTAKVKDIFTARLVALLKNLAANAERQITAIQREQPVSPVKVAEFRATITEEYERIASIRYVLRHFGCFKDRTNDKCDGALHRWGISIADAKAAFFEKWHIHYVGWGTNYGQRLAIGEDTDISNQIAEKCTKIAPDALDVSIAPIAADAVILATPLAVLTAFENTDRFISYWQADAGPKLDVKGFQGWYVSGQQRVPVFEFHSDKADRRILLLAKSRLGEMCQLSPLDQEDAEQDRVGHLLIKVKAFSEDAALSERTLKDPPPWLRKIEDAEKQKEYLKERVWIQVLERYEFLLHKNFIGYMFDAPEN